MSATTFQKLVSSLNLTEKQKVANDRTLNRALLEVQLIYAATLLAYLEKQKSLLSDERLTADERLLLEKGPDGKLPLIKSIRERLGLGLGDAKKYVEELRVEFNMGYWSDQGSYKQFNWHPEYLPRVKNYPPPATY